MMVSLARVFTNKAGYFTDECASGVLGYCQSQHCLAAGRKHGTGKESWFNVS